MIPVPFANIGEYTMNSNELLQLVAQATTAAMFKELNKRNMLKPDGKTAYQKMETLLYGYPKYREIIKSKLQEIEAIKRYGVSKGSCSFVQYNSNRSRDFSNDYEKAEIAIEKLQSSISKIESYLSSVDSALQIVKDDPYFEIIELKYFKGCSQEEIADYLVCDVKTVGRNKNRLLKRLHIHLFPNESLTEIGFIA